MSASILCQLCEFMIVLGPWFQWPVALPETLPPIPQVFESGIVESVDDPLAYRLPLENGSSDALFVALRKNENYAFDLMECRLKFAWTGPFLKLLGNDDRFTLSFGNPPESIQPLGSIYFNAPETFPLRIGPNPDDSAQPARYQGYTLVAGHPRFHYSLGSAEVSELLNVAPEGNGLIRLFSIEKLTQTLWFYSGESPQVFENGIRKTADQSNWIPLKPDDNGNVRFEVLTLRGSGEIRISSDSSPIP